MTTATTTLDLVRAGRRAMVRRPVERFPHAAVDAGTAGTIMFASADGVSWRPDGPMIDGLREWEGCLEWYPADRADDARANFLRDCGAIA